MNTTGTLVDHHGRHITYLRMSIIDRCNLRCHYCMPKDGVSLLPKQAVLSLEEIVEVGRAARDLGITKLRITGGEPLIKRGVVKIVKELSALAGIKEVALTTNGVRLSKYATILKEVGLSRVNVSLDTLEPDLYRRITRGGDVGTVLHGIDAAQEVGLPVKINAVLQPKVTETTLSRFLDFAAAKRVGIRFIERMGFEESVPFVESSQIVSMLQSGHALVPLPSDSHSPHVQRYRCDDLEIGFISPRTHAFCDSCNKLRLTAGGRLQACLASDLHVDLKPLLRIPHHPAVLFDAFRRVVSIKPSKGPWSVPGTMWQVGG